MELKELHSETAQQKEATPGETREANLRVSQTHPSSSFDVSCYIRILMLSCSPSPAKMLSELVRESSAEAAQLRPDVWSINST